jgi:hypothetical protein
LTEESFFAWLIVGMGSPEDIVSIAADIFIEVLYRDCFCERWMLGNQNK